MALLLKLKPTLRKNNAQRGRVEKTKKSEGLAAPFFAIMSHSMSHSMSYLRHLCLVSQRFNQPDEEVELLDQATAFAPLAPEDLRSHIARLDAE